MAIFTAAPGFGPLAPVMARPSSTASRAPPPGRGDTWQSPCYWGIFLVKGIFQLVRTRQLPEEHSICLPSIKGTSRAL